LQQLTFFIFFDKTEIITLKVIRDTSGETFFILQLNKGNCKAIILSQVVDYSLMVIGLCNIFSLSMFKTFFTWIDCFGSLIYYWFYHLHGLLFSLRYFIKSTYYIYSCIIKVSVISNSLPDTSLWSKMLELLYGFKFGDLYYVA